MKKYSITAFLILFLNVLAMGQNSTTSYFVDKLSVLASDSKIEIRGKDTMLVSEYKNPNVRFQSQNDFKKFYKGTPFFNNGWFRGSITTETGGVSKGYMAYNVLTNSLFFSIGENKEAVEIRPKEFTLNGNTFKKFRNQYVAAGELYYQQIVGGETELFRNFKCKYTPSVVGEKTGYEQTGDGYEGYFEKETTYYINYHNKMQRVGKKFKIFDENEDKAKAFAEKYDLSLQNPSDLIKIVKHINGLDSNL